MEGRTKTIDCPLDFKISMKWRSCKVAKDMYAFLVVPSKIQTWIPVSISVNQITLRAVKYHSSADGLICFSAGSSASVAGLATLKSEELEAARDLLRTGGGSIGSEYLDCRI